MGKLIGLAALLLLLGWAVWRLGHRKPRRAWEWHER